MINSKLPGSKDIDRLESFEKMLAEIIEQVEYEQAEMDRLKKAGKKKLQLINSISEIECCIK